MPFGRSFDLVYDTARLAFPKQPAVSLDGIIDADEAQRIPHAGLRRRHHGHAEFLLQRFDGFDHWPVRRRQKIASACGCARISARPMSSAAVTGMRPKSLMSLPHPMTPSTSQP